MTDPRQECPDGLELVTSPIRTCQRPQVNLSVHTQLLGCVSTTFPTHGMEYSQVCGKIIGYQFDNTQAFRPYIYHYDTGRSRTIDGFYVDGVSLTHGQSPRQHIWTFASALTDSYTSTRSIVWIYNQVCPCTNYYDSFQPPYNYELPPWMGEDYFCDTGAHNSPYHNINRFLPDDPLWDGQGCGGNSTCCSFNNPPWFCKRLAEPTTDDIELRLCSGVFTHSDGYRSQVRLESVHLFVK